MAAGEVHAMGPPVTTVDRVYDWGGGLLGFGLILVGLILAAFIIPLSVSGYWPAGAAAGAALSVVVVVVAVLVRSEIRRQVTGPYGSPIVAALNDVRKVWTALPTDMQEAARPLIDKAFEVATVAHGAEEAIKARLALLRLFEAEAAERQKTREAAAVSDDDLTMAEGLLRGFQEAREAGELP